MTWLLVMVLEISVVMAFGFVLGRVWPLVEVRSVWITDYEAEMDDFTPPLIGRIPTSCATATAERLYYPRPLNGGSLAARVRLSSHDLKASFAGYMKHEFPRKRIVTCQPAASRRHGLSRIGRLVRREG